MIDIEHNSHKPTSPYYLTTAVLNDCYSGVTAYIVLAYSYRAISRMIMPRPLMILTTTTI